MKAAMRRRNPSTFACLSILVLSAVTASPADEARAEIEKGRALYLLHCATCHGETGAGDGPSATKLTPRPPDLRRIEKTLAGEFPSDRISSLLDGREERPAHVARDMPIWGYAFQELDLDTDQEAEVRRRIDSLVRFLEAIQSPD